MLQPAHDAVPIHVFIFLWWWYKGYGPKTADDISTAVFCTLCLFSFLHVVFFSVFISLLVGFIILVLRRIWDNRVTVYDA
jgi:hypothetical protein